MPSPQTFFVLETSLAKRLRGTWEPIGARLARQILNAFKEGKYEDLEKAIQKIELGRAMDGNVAYTKLMGKGSVLFGASRVRSIDDTKALQEKGTTGVVAQATTQVRMILDASSRTARRQIRRSLDSERDRQEKGGITKAELINSFAASLSSTLVEGNGMIDLASSLHTSRLASFGFTVEANLMNVTTYYINAVLDARTCPVCAHMDGRVYEVRKLHENLLRTFAADNVDDLKRLAPWPSQSKAGLESLQRMTSEEIQNNGYGAPPFHPLCRCFIDFDETGMQVVEEAVQATIPIDLGLIAIERPTIAVPIDGDMLVVPDDMLDR